MNSRSAWPQTYDVNRHRRKAAEAFASCRVDRPVRAGGRDTRPRQACVRLSPPAAAPGCQTLTMREHGHGPCGHGANGSMDMAAR